MSVNVWHCDGIKVDNGWIEMYRLFSKTARQDTKLPVPCFELQSIILNREYRSFSCAHFLCKQRQIHDRTHTNFHTKLLIIII